MTCTRRRKPNTGGDFPAVAVPSMKGHGYLDYTIESHPSKARERMDEFRRHDQLCDLVLHVTYKDQREEFRVSGGVGCSRLPESHSRDAAPKLGLKPGMGETAVQ
ncbi:UNVERIFIED_CONTAM: hypothetical protein FKN15_015200 [Acipenser sinensis]